jgi:hypothetical protein
MDYLKESPQRQDQAKPKQKAVATRTIATGGADGYDGCRVLRYCSVGKSQVPEGQAEDAFSGVV